MLLCGNCSAHINLPPNTSGLAVSSPRSSMGVRRRSRRMERPSQETSDSEQELRHNGSTGFSSSSRSSPTSVSKEEACPDRTSYAQKKCKEAIDEYHEKAISSSSPAVVIETVDEVGSSGVSSATTTPPSGGLQPLPRSKVIVLGNSGVGKTSIIYNHKYGSGLLPCNATIGASYINFDLVVKGEEPMQLQLWDTAGQERFRCMVPMYMRNADAAILVYDITERKSFDEIEKWLAEISRCSNFNEPIVVLIGNKADMSAHREVAEGEGVLKASKLNAKFYEISALDSEVIDSIFMSIAERIHERTTAVSCYPQSDAIRLPTSPESILRNGRISLVGSLRELPKKASRDCCTLL